MASAGYNVSSSQDGCSLAINPTLWKPSYSYVVNSERRVPVGERAAGPFALAKKRTVANSKLSSPGNAKPVNAKLKQTVKRVNMSTRPVVSVLKVVTGGRVPLTKHEAKVKLGTLIAWSTFKPEVSQQLWTRLEERYNNGKMSGEENTDSLHSSPMHPSPLRTRLSDVVTP